MSHRVPNLDALSPEVVGTHQSPSPSGKVEFASTFFCDHRGLDYSGDRKRTDACIFNLDGMASQVSWLQTDDEEKRTSMFEINHGAILATDFPIGHVPCQEDEMLSWLQYPLDDSFSKTYCSEQHGEQAFTSFSSQSLFQGANNEKPPASSLLQTTEKDDSTTGTQSVTKDAAMALGAKRAAGLLAHTGTEAFNRVHTIRQASQDASSSKLMNTIVAPNTCEGSPSRLEHAGRHNTMNFPFFSQRVAAMKSSFQILGASGGPSIKDRLQQPLGTLTEERLSSVEQSTTVTSLGNLDDISKDAEQYGGNQGVDNSLQNYIDPVICHDKVGQIELKFNSHDAAVGTELLETGDVTLTSLSGASDYSTDKSAKDVSCKRKSVIAEEYECESKNTGGVALQEINPAMARASSAKRTRAAEVHNQSERRRRDKINQKMKALQELIPNANKTDKASMLDEAIEYVKMLQGQLQLMSMRTGMIVPPVMMPPGMQYLSQQQGPTIPPMNMARGLNGAVAAGVMDASNSGIGSLPRPVFLGQPFPGQVYHHMTGYPPYSSPSVVHDVRSQFHDDPLRTSPASQLLQRTASIQKVNVDPRKQQQNEPQ